MPEEIGLRDNGFAYAAANLISCYYSCQHIFTAFMLRLSNGKYRRYNYCSQMYNRWIMKVIKIK